MANESGSGSRPSPVKLGMKKLMYKSPLSGIRSAPYKPPVDKSGFKPLGVSSPKHENNTEGDRFALDVEGPLHGRHRPPKLENERIGNNRVDSEPSPTGDSSVIHLSLGGRGGHWRGPQGNDMSPENRRGGRRQGYNSSPASEGTAQWYSPVQNMNDSSNNESFSPHKSKGFNNFRNNSNFGSNPHSPHSSPRGQFNSSDSSFNSPRNNNRRGGGNRGGNRGGHRSNGDITVFYSSLMNVDPWSELIHEKMNSSSFQSRTIAGGPGLRSVEVSSSSEVENESIASQGPVGDNFL